jgi:membrane protease YdiL (CAAX protease family)
MLFFILNSILLPVFFMLFLEITGTQFNGLRLQTFGFLITFLPVTAGYLIFTRKRIGDVCFLSMPGFLNCVLTVIITMLVQPLAMFLAGLSSLVFPNEVAGAVESFLGTAPFWAVLITSAVLPAVFEELVFRGIFFAKDSNLPVTRRILISSFFFALAHLSPQQFLYAFVMGIIFAAMMYVTRSIFIPMLAHFTMNASQVYLQYTAMQQYNYAAEAAAEVTAASIVQNLLSVLVLFFVTLPVLIFAVYLLIINNREKIAFHILFTKLRMLTQYYEKAMEEQSKNKGADENGEDRPFQIDIKVDDFTQLHASGENSKTPRKYFTWEFWVVVALYVLFVAYFYVYLPASETTVATLF